MIKRLSRSMSVWWFIVSLTAPSALAFEWRSTWENTWGYYLMSPKERNDHERAVRNLKTMAECEAYIKHHNHVIEERIDNRQIKPKRPIPVDLCGQLFEWRSTWENTWGYYLMSPKERNDHERAVRNFKTMMECEAYIKHLNRVIQERIDNRQIKPKRPIPVDLCGQLKAEGKIENE